MKRIRANQREKKVESELVARKNVSRNKKQRAWRTSELALKEELKRRLRSRSSLTIARGSVAVMFVAKRCFRAWFGPFLSRTRCAAIFSTEKLTHWQRVVVRWFCTDEVAGRKARIVWSEMTGFFTESVIFGVFCSDGVRRYCVE